MGGNDDQKKVTGPLPTLFVGVGVGVRETLAEFSRMAQGLTVPLQGPFGLVLLEADRENLFTCDWSRASDLRFPPATSTHEGWEFIGREDRQLMTSLSSLVRRLQSVEPGADPTPASRVHVSSYVVIDLSDAAAAASALWTMQALRQVDSAVDTTVLGLTARTAANSSPGDDRWFEIWKRFLEELQGGPLAQRVYLLDGCDADKVWFERPEQLHRLGAEFLFYHGLTCRSSLRQSERARTGVHESLLNVCGSFGCRTIAAELTVVAERVAERVAREELADLYQRTVPSNWLGSLQTHARLLIDRIATLCEQARQAGPSVPVERRGRPDTRRSVHAEIIEAVRTAIKQVCLREPLLSLCLFLQLLRPKLARLLSQQRLWERIRTRHTAILTFRRHLVNTYEPMRTWLARTETRWVDRFTPAQQPMSEVAVSRPGGRKGYLAGGFVLVIGLAAVTLGVFLPSRLVAMGGGLVSVAASALMMLPTGWTQQARSQLRNGQQVRTSVPPQTYRKGPSRRIGLICTVLVLAGLVGVTWSLWPNVWTSYSWIWGVMLAVTIGVGLACVVSGPSEVRPDQVSVKEAPGHVNPPIWRYRVVGLTSLALAWVVFCLGSPSWTTVETIAPRPALLIGMVLVAAGVGLALFPRVGYVYLVDRVVKLPQPLVGGIAHPVKESQLPYGVTTLAAWVNRLILDPDQCLERLRGAQMQPARETLLDFLADDWEGRLAQAFRQAVEARSGRPLKTLALQPGLWAECIAGQLHDSRGGGCELASLFALQAVKAWVESHTLPELLSLLDIDLARFAGLVGRLASPHWPPPRIEPDMSASVIAVGRSLWDVLAPLAGMQGVPPVVLLDWDAHDDAIVVLRAVQGLAQGWRGFPGFTRAQSATVASGSGGDGTQLAAPGLSFEPSPTTPVQTGKDRL